MKMSLGCLTLLVGTCPKHRFHGLLSIKTAEIAAEELGWFKTKTTSEVVGIVAWQPAVSFRKPGGWQLVKSLDPWIWRIQLPPRKITDIKLQTQLPQWLPQEWNSKTATEKNQGRRKQWSKCGSWGIKIFETKCCALMIFGFWESPQRSLT